MIPLCISYYMKTEFLYKKKLEKKKKDKNTVFILKYICCSLENVLYLFSPQSFTDTFLKSIQVMAAFT